MPSTSSGREVVERVLSERGIRVIDLPPLAKPLSEAKIDRVYGDYRTRWEIGPEWHDEPYTNADCWVDPDTVPPHNTRRGIRNPQFVVEGEVTPKPGQSASAARVAAHRLNPEVRQRERLGTKARDTAFRRLAAKFPAEYVKLLNQERANLGMPAIESRGPYRTKTESRIAREEERAERARQKHMHADEQKLTRPPSHNSPKNPKNQPLTPGIPGKCKHEDVKLAKLSYGTVCHPRNGGCGGRVR